MSIEAWIVVLLCIQISLSSTTLYLYWRKYKQSHQ